MRTIVNLLAGLIFGVGLVVSGMNDPAKVLNFLDLFGTWDPSLAFVMAGALAVTFAGYRLAWQRKAPLLADRFDLPTSRIIDRKLIAGAAIFGIGWGLAGFCPGPAVTALATFRLPALVFFVAMLLGILAARWFQSNVSGNEQVGAAK